MPALCEVCQCNGCSACASICPTACISMQADTEGFLRPYVDETKCIACGLCEKTCPVLNPPNLPKNQPDCFAAVNNSNQERLQASSGGVFVLLERWVLNKNGVIFGAAFEPDFSVSHRYAENEQEASAFCGSKYLQSRIGNAYREAKTFLEQGRYVLFSGTPCQIVGLRSYLGRDYERLVTMDIICHGVPSPAVWQKYVQERAERDSYGQLPVEVSFRTKASSWSKFSMRFTYREKEYCVPYYEDSYMRGFLRNLYLRPSCHQCIAKGVRRVSDITVADFWGVQQVCPEMDDDRGVSIVFLHSEKAKHMWSDISKTLRDMPVDVESAVQKNSAAIKSVDCHPNRAVFFERFPTCEDLSSLILELTPNPVVKPPSLYRRIRSKLSRFLRRITRAKLL